ncbi:uncharacterized protein ACHE_31138S [Aspergillus chevalieri]|uniref:Uncharacterized protein n=1 Tax=Aspergillus chevalieri TaxID=182096 RepID=A0A7R7VLZ5_ASPCH|nr:uncharacterized protein ACHE_31138S [Aspergillus chevalieri]BCR87151.1 hypothetical protein ACHE_31138S [Aspergillus chevalieri]
MTALPKFISSTLLRRPNTTLLAATRFLTPEISTSFFHLPKHDTSLVIPVKIDLFSQYDAVGTVRGLLLAGVTHINAVVFEGGSGTGVRGGGSWANGVNGRVNRDVGRDAEYEEGLRRLFGQVRMFLGGSRFVFLRKESGMDVEGVREVVMTEVGDVASFFQVDVPDGEGEEWTATERILQLMDHNEQGW